MILTGKAKEDFLKWKNVPDDYLLFTQKNHMYSDIIEWFDSVCIHISVNYVYLFNDMENKKGFETYVTCNNHSTKFRYIPKRTEATKQAIIKARDIYNNLNK